MEGVSIPGELIQMMNFKKKPNSDKYVFSLKHQKLEVLCWELLGHFLAILSEVG